MSRSSHKPWVVRTILVGVGYFAVGFVSAALANPSASNQVKFFWRLSAWFISGVIFAVHIWYEHFRLANSPLATAIHAGSAVAVGAFFLAAAATIHRLLVLSPVSLRSYSLALIIWPVVTGLPMFLAALVLTALLARFRRT